MRRHGSNYPTGGLYEYMHLPPLFTHQYQNLYYDLRDKHDGLADYWDAAVKATQRDIQQCAADTRYKSDIWGLTACETQNRGYMVYGTEPDGYRDGTAAPTGPLASMPMASVESLRSGRKMYFQYKHAIWGRHGFTDSFNTYDNERADNALGLDNAPIILAIENHRSNLVRDTFMKSPIALAGLAQAGFVATGAAPMYYSRSEKDAHHAQYAFDKNPATRWESVWADGEWLAVDFGKNTTVSHVRLLWETAYAENYAIQKSPDGVSWSDVQAVSGSNGGQDDVFFAPAASRFFRIYTTKRHVTPNGVWGNSLWEASFEHRPPSAAPTGLTASSQTGTSLHWTWNDNADNEEGYRLYGATSAAGPFSLVAQLPAQTTAYVEFSLTPGITYYRKVVAFNRAGELSSNVVTAATISLFTSFGPSTADGIIRAVLDDTGKLHVTHFDPSNQGIRYTAWNGTAWSLDEMIDSQATGYPTADGSAIFLVANDLAVDAAGRPHVVYYSLNGSLRYAVKNAGVWTLESIAPAARSVSPSLAVDPAGGVHVVYSDPGTLYYAKRGTATWTVEPVAGGVTANSSHLALDGTSQPHIVYGSNDYPHSLRYTRRGISGWSAPETADSLDVGRYRVEPTILLDGNGQPRVMDCLNNRDGRVRYSVRSSTAWAAEYAHYDQPDWDHTGTPTPGFVLDGAGTPHTLYDMHFNYDPHYTRITLAKRTTQGWQETVLAEDARWGPGSALAMDAQGRAHIVTQSTEGKLRLIRWDTGAPAPLGGGRNSRVQAPTGFTVQLTTAGLKCAWQDRAANETGYRVYGSTKPYGPFAVIAELPANATAFYEPLPGNATIYRYVAARNAGGEAYSAQASSVILKPAAPGTPSLASRTTNSLTWRWTDNASNETGFRVIRSSNGAVLKEGLLPNTTYWTQLGLGVNTPQQVRVDAYNVGGASSSPASSLLYTFANKPTGTKLTPLSGKLALTWNTNGNPLGTLFRAYRSLDNLVFSQIYAGTGNVVYPTGLSSGKTYYFKVRAQNGNSTYTAFDITASTKTARAIASLAVGESIPLPGKLLSVSFAGSAPAGSSILLEPLEQPSSAPKEPWRMVAEACRVLTDPEDGPLLLVASILGKEGSARAVGRWSDPSTLWEIQTPGSASPPGNYALLATTLAAPDTPDAARVFPNPFRPAHGPAEVTINNVPAGTRVRFYTMAGELVRELRADSGSVQWDGKNQEGRAVASGVYLGIADSDGNIKKFRLAVEQ